MIIRRALGVAGAAALPLTMGHTTGVRSRTASSDVQDLQVVHRDNRTAEQFVLASSRRR